MIIWEVDYTSSSDWEQVYYATRSGAEREFAEAVRILADDDTEVTLSKLTLAPMSQKKLLVAAMNSIGFVKEYQEIKRVVINREEDDD